MHLDVRCFDQCYTVQHTSRLEQENFQIFRFRRSPFFLKFLSGRQVPTSLLRTGSILVNHI